MSVITSVKGRIVFNSRGTKSIEVDVISDNEYLGRACAPSGASVGQHEAISFAKNDPELSLQILNSNRDKFVGLDASEPKAVFEVLKSIDNSETYQKIGGAVAYALSVAAADAVSKSENIPLFKSLRPSGPYEFPYPIGNVLGGGSHAGPGTPDIQEILVCPLIAKNMVDALEVNFKVHKEVGHLLEEMDRRFPKGRGDEGAWAPNLNNDMALTVVANALDRLGFRLGREVGIGIDFAASSLWDKSSASYRYARQGISRNSEQQIQFVLELVDKYKLIYIEDPVHEDDFENMAKITSTANCLVVGDDMLVTNTERIRKAKAAGACNAGILKVNQAGSLYEAMNYAKEATSSGMKIITSHRSGESIDAHISHIAIATSSIMIKTGILGGERIAKLNEFIRLSEYGLIKGLAEVSNIYHE
ncbi:MAG TPA: enolase C-terminal domain-like protein [Nitrososphaeraceae archaeon]|jgi:enolase